MKGDKAIYNTPIGKREVEVEYVNEYGTAHIRALHGAPFTIRGSKFPYGTCQTDEWSCDVRKLDFEDDRDWFEDPAWEDAEAGRERTTQDDYLDEQYMYDCLRHGG